MASTCGIRAIKRTLHEGQVEENLGDTRADLGGCGAFEDGQESVVEAFPL